MVTTHPAPTGREDFQSVASSLEFLDSLNTGLMLFAVDGRLVDCNQAAADLCGLDIDHITEWRLGDFRNQLSEDGTELAPSETPASQTLRTGEPCLDVVCALRLPSGVRQWLKVNSWPFTRDNALAGAVVSLEDFTLARRSAHLLALHKDVMQSVVETRDETVALQTFCDSIVKQLDFDSAWIGISSRSVDHGIEVICASGRVDTVNASFISTSADVEEGNGFVGTALRNGTTQRENQLLQSVKDAPWRDVNAKAGFNSGLAIPMKAFDRRGVLCILDSQTFAFDDETVEQLQTLADEIQYGIAHLDAVRQLHESLAGTLAALRNMTEIRDPYTAGHQGEVADLSMAIATSLNLDPNLISLIGQSGDVHDIGKVGVPAEILTRPGRLTETEFELIKTHAQLGYDILASANLPWPIPHVALEHHERIDGSGYPQGLRGDKISLAAKIVAVADVVEAMTHRRPYREALGIDLALAEIQNGAGTLYDVDVVKACVQLFANGYRFKFDNPLN